MQMFRCEGFATPARVVEELAGSFGDLVGVDGAARTRQLGPEDLGGRRSDARAIEVCRVVELGRGHDGHDFAGGRNELPNRIVAPRLRLWVPGVLQRRPQRRDQQRAVYKLVFFFFCLFFFKNPIPLPPPT